MPNYSTRMERYTEALPELRRALELDPENLRALSLLNITSFLLNDHNLKWSSFQTVIERARQSETNLKQFIEEYRQASLLNGVAGLYYALACLQLEHQQPKQAERLFNQALEADEIAPKPNQGIYAPLLQWQLGQLFLEQHRADDAVDALTKATAQVDKADPISYANAGAPYGALPSQI